MRAEHWLYTLPLRLRSLLRRNQVDQELREELQQHLDQQIEQNIAAGMTPEQARLAALQALGGITQIEEHCRETRRVRYIQDLFQDLRFGLRQIFRTPGPSLLSVLCLVVGIGATASVFSWIEGILLRPYPGVAHQERLVALSGTKSLSDRKNIEGGYTGLSWPDWQDFARSCQLFDSFIVARIMGTTLNIGDHAQVVAGMVVSSNYFHALGVRPILGRGFQPDEDFGRNAHPVTVISYWMWKEVFAKDPAIIGKTQLLNGVPHTIIGVAPEVFQGTFVGYNIGFWVPVSMQETFVPGGYQLEDRSALWIEGYARLKNGVSMAQAQQEISAVAKQLESSYLGTNRGRGVQLFPLWKTPFNQAGSLRPTLQLTLAAVLLVLLIACANVSSLLLVRSLARRHEMAVRLAIGARRGRLLKQLLTEGLMLSATATVGALLLAYWSRNMLALIFEPGASVSRNLHGEMDWRVFVVSAAVCIVSTLLFGLIPALQSSNVDLSGVLKSESGTFLGSGRGKSHIRSAMVVAQVSLGFLLVLGAVLLLQSLRQIRTADPGFSTDNVLTTTVNLTSAGYDERRARTFQQTLLERVQALPGVESAAWARVLPFSYAPYFSARIAVDGYVPGVDEQPEAEYNQVSPGYFATMGIPLLAGREFTDADNETGPPVAVVNQKMAEQYWHGEDPVGRRLVINGKPVRVVGLARLARYETFGEQPKAFFYVPLRQNFARTPDLLIRSSQPPTAIASSVANEIRAIDANLAPAELITLHQHILRSALSAQQIAVTLLTLFGTLALLLAGIGLYGVISYTVSQGTRELALRVAVGARATDVLRLVMSHGLALTALGVLLGAVAGLLLTRLIGNLLYQVNPRDPLAFIATFVVMFAAAATACLVPALRAARTDPALVLRD